jgi:hypothetical protein
MEQTEPLIVLIAAFPHCKDGKWQTSGVDDPGDHAGATFDRFRVLATSVLAVQYPQAKLLLSSGARYPDTPSGATVAARELTELGVDPGRFILEEHSQSVHGQLYEIGKMAVTQKFGHMLLVTNDWHHPRVVAMIKHAPHVEMWKDLSWESISAEQVMLDSGNSIWQKMVAAERVHPKYVERVEMEEQGVRQVVEGTYKYKPL